MEESGRKPVVLRRTRLKRTREETAGFVLVIVTGSLAVLLGGFYLARHVGQPFDVSYTGPEFFTTAQQQAREVEEQKTIDTDGDTISDYDELYVIRTSPYLSDTDGDGIDDLVELEAGTDPTCASNADCSSSTYVNPFAEAGNGESGFDTLLPEEAVSPDDLSAEELLESVQQLSPAEIRDLLISSGADAAQVNQLSDEQILALYDSVLTDLEDSGQLDELTSP